MKSILMVDDETHILEVAKLSFERYAGYSLDTASSPEEALTILAKERYDVIVSDYEMPNMNGASFLNALRERGNHTPFIILTARGREEVAAECLSAGADRYLERSGTSDSWIAMLQSEIDSIISLGINGAPASKIEGIVESEIQAILNDSLEGTIREEVDALKSLSRIHVHDRMAVEDIIQAVMSDKKPRSGLFRMRAPGHWSWQHGLFTHSAMESGVSLSIKSIDESRVALLDMESTWRSIATVLDNSPFNVDLIDSDMNMLYSNRFKLKGKKCYRVIKGQKFPCDDCGLKESLQVGQEVRRFFNEQGKEMDTLYIPVLDKGSRPKNVVRIQSERKAPIFSDQTLETLLDTNRKLHLLTSITRHDILNQLTAMLGYLELYDDFPDKRETIISRMKELISNVDKQVSFTRTYQRLGITAPSWQDCSVLLWSAVEECGINPQMVSVEGQLPLVFGDPMLGKVMANILSNSMMHGKKVSFIRAWFEVKNESGCLFIADDGIGIPIDKKERIFERRQGDDRNGYGLFLIRMILDITGITITEIGEEGQGACFCIDIPANVYTLKNG